LFFELGYSHDCLSLLKYILRYGTAGGGVSAVYHGVLNYIIPYHSSRIVPFQLRWFQGSAAEGASNRVSDDSLLGPADILQMQVPGYGRADQKQQVYFLVPVYYPDYGEKLE
jgi:hypothetical protein